MDIKSSIRLVQIAPNNSRYNTGCSIEGVSEAKEVIPKMRGGLEHTEDGSFIMKV